MKAYQADIAKFEATDTQVFGLSIDSPYANAEFAKQIGVTFSVNGVCLTALELKPDSFAADVSKETLFRSTLGSLKEGSPVNLERAVTPVTRLGGHIVQGHVDGRGKFLGSENHGDSWTFRFAYPKEIASYLVFKGSVAVEGVSLTSAELTDD